MGIFFKIIFSVLLICDLNSSEFHKYNSQYTSISLIAQLKMSVDLY